MPMTSRAPRRSASNEKKPSGASDIQNPLACQVFRQTEVREFFLRRIAPAGAMEARQDLQLLEPIRLGFNLVPKPVLH
jgi:hypothetical protein